ncbi:MAG: histidine kinase [Pseudomonadota bacterium]
MDHKLPDDEHATDHRVLAAIDAERCRLAKELHDGLGQALTGVLLMSSAGREARDGDAKRQLATLLAEAAERTRGLSRTLDPSAQTSSLARLLGDLASELSERFQRPFDVAPGLPEASLTGTERQHLHHLIVDAARFAMLHKGVKDLTLSAAASNQLAVQVDARFDKREVGVPPGDEKQVQACLALLRGRLQALGGKFSAETGTGTLSMRLRWPH